MTIADMFVRRRDAQEHRAKDGYVIQDVLSGGRAGFARWMCDGPTLYRGEGENQGVCTATTLMQNDRLFRPHISNTHCHTEETCISPDNCPLSYGGIQVRPGP